MTYPNIRVSAHSAVYLGPTSNLPPEPADTAEKRSKVHPPFLGTQVDVVAIVASQGALAAFIFILAALPAAFPAAILLLRHTSPTHQSMLADILTSRTRLRVAEASDGEQVRPGSVYVAPPNHNLFISPGGVLLFSKTERQPFNDHTADALLTSVANSFRQRAVAVILTGANSDGAMGVRAIKQAGGVVVAQDKATSEAFAMPRAAIATECVDFVLPLGKIAPLLEVLMAACHP